MQFLDILPQNVNNWKGTEKFLKELVEILLQYIKEENDRNSKILDFHHPAEMQQLIDLSIPDHPQTLAQLLEVCHPYVDSI